MIEWGNISLVTDSALLILLVASFAIMCSVHAIIYKREAYAAFAWLGVILLSPLIFSLMFVLWDWKGVLVIAPLIASCSYLFLGINRLSRKFKQGAFRKRDQQLHHHINEIVEPLLNENRKWAAIASTGNKLAYSPIHYCDLTALNSGSEAYPKMLEAITQAKKSISLYSYIFTYDATGKLFCEALIEARKRGVEVKVLVDAVGSHITIKQLARQLKLGGVDFGRFMPVLLKTQFSNLRNHRKLLVVDAELAFTGGLNIEDLYWPELYSGEAALDLHFKVEGRLVNYLQEVFANDWLFAMDEQLKGDCWFSEELPEQGKSLGRVIVDGPSRDEERLTWHFLNAINVAEKTICIATPYFLPNTSIVSGLCSAALRGVRVEILLPEKTDHRFLDWAVRGNLFELVNKGCVIYFSTGAFDHSKFLLIDNDYTSIGSSNWDARSLRLNYELNVEVYSRVFSNTLALIFEKKKQSAYLYTETTSLNRSFFKKLRDGFMRLFTPYL